MGFLDTKRDRASDEYARNDPLQQGEEQVLTESVCSVSVEYISFYTRWLFSCAVQYPDVDASA
jgi:hypothetical protein